MLQAKANKLDNTCYTCNMDEKEVFALTMTGKDMVAKLKKDGWRIDRIQGSHHIMVKEGRLPVTIPVHGNKDLLNGTFHQIMKESGLKG